MSRLGFFAAQTSTIPTDPFWANVVLLCHFDGVNGQTTSTDSSTAAHTLTFAGIASLQSTAAKFGTTGLDLSTTANSAFVTSPDSADWNFGSGSWTVELFVNPATSATATQRIIGQWQSSPANKSWAINRSNTGHLEVTRSIDGALTLTDIDVAATMTSGTWYNVAADYDSSTLTLRLYLNGVMLAKQVQARILFDSTVALGIGNQPDGSAFKYAALFDEVRITKGIARYASDAGFSVTSSAFPNS